MSEILDSERKIVVARELTKIHEEFIRGTISEVTDYFEQNAPRGEFVVLISPNAAQETQLSWAELIKAVNRLVDKGESKKSAIKTVAQENNVSKNELYERYHQK